MNEVKQYAERDLMAMDFAGDHYCRHVSAMTSEQLHSKSDIAAELGWRDMQIASLKEQLTATTNILKSAGIEANTVQAGVMELVSKLAALIPDENVEASLNALKKGYFKRWVKEYSSPEAKSGYVAGSINVKDIVSAFNYADACAAQLRAGNAGKDGSHE